MTNANKTAHYYFRNVGDEHFSHTVNIIQYHIIQENSYQFYGSPLSHQKKYGLMSGQVTVNFFI